MSESMNQYKNVADLFEEEPVQWGLRGDPYLWREMREHFSAIPIPGSITDLEKEIEKAFLLIAGKHISSSEHFFVDRFAHGGMSSGYISPEFWRDRAMPLIKKRFEGK
jgi:hypothetical protein